MINDAAESQDLAQEVFVRLWRSREIISDPRALTAWLYRTCTRLAIDRARSRGRQDVALAAIAARGDGEGTASPSSRAPAAARWRRSRPKRQCASWKWRC